MEYHREFYNEVRDDEQWIRLSDGCFRSCWNCYCPKDKLSYELPTIERNKVRFLDMNFLYAHNSPKVMLESLAKIKVENKVVRYAFLCGLDFSLLTPEIIGLCKKARIGRFNNKGHWVNGLTIAWDRGLDEQIRIIQAIENIEAGGYLKRNIACFMLCNGKVGFQECLRKLRVLKEQRVQIQDCWYDNQKRGHIKPVYWTQIECDIFGDLCRAHNIAIIQNQYDRLDILYLSQLVDVELEKQTKLSEVKVAGGTPTTNDGIPPNNKLSGILPTILGKESNRNNTRPTHSSHKI